MTQDNVETIRDIYEGIRRMGGATALLALPDATRKNLYDQIFDPELEIRQSAELVLDTAGTFHGYEGFIDCTRELVEGLGDIRFDPGQAFESGDKVVFEVRALAVGKESGVPVQGRLAHLWELKNGRVHRWVVYPTLAEALEAAGLSEQAMSQENVEIVRKVYEAVREGDAEGVLAAYDPAVEWDFRNSPFRDFVKENVYLGHDGIRRFIRERHDDALTDIEDHLDELIDAGEHVISVVTSRGRGLSSGVEVGREHAGLWTIQAGKIVRVAWFGSRAEAVEAAGLPE